MRHATSPVHRGRRRPLALAGCVLALALAGCAGEVSPDTPLSEVAAKGGGDADDLRKGAREAGRGVFTQAETDCATDKLFTRSDITVGQVQAFNEKPDASGPVQAAYQQIYGSCIDPAAVVPPAPVPAELRDGLIKGFTSAVPGLTEAQGGCLLDRLGEQGLTVRDLVIAGYVPDRAQALAPKLQPLLAACQGG